MEKLTDGPSCRRKWQPPHDDGASGMQLGECLGLNFEGPASTPPSGMENPSPWSSRRALATGRPADILYCYAVPGSTFDSLQFLLVYW